jgi:uncharacterized membrane protein YqaE (UPF0057 family)
MISARGFMLDLTSYLTDILDSAMRYLLALLLPPVAVFLCAKPIQGILNIFLCLFFLVPGIIHALFVVHNHLADKRNNQLINAIKNNHGGA